MTLPANSRAFSENLPSEEAQAVANQLRRLLASAREGEIDLYAHPSTSDEVTKVDLHPAVSDVLLEVLRYIGSGDAVTLLPITKALTTQQAADILNMSRPSLVKLLMAGEIPFTSVGRHRRIKAEELFEYKRRMSEKRSAALTELAESDADLF